MYSLVYVSSATRPFTSVELQALLERSRTNNAAAGVTGMLLYRAGNFMQVLEGEQADVEAVFRRVAADPRHSGVLVLLKGDSEARMFSQWWMAFRELADADLRALPGFSDFLNTRAEDRSYFTDPTRAQKLLLYFKQSMR